MIEPARCDPWTVAQVPETGLEPARSCDHQALKGSNGGTPIPPCMSYRIGADENPFGDGGEGRVMKTWLILLLVVGLFAAGVLAEDGEAKFKITTKRKDDTVEVRANKVKALFILRSPFGISQAVIERVGDKWPNAVVLRLHLKGLENFRASNGKVTIHAAAAIQEGKQKVRIWKNGKEDAPLDEKSPFWTDIRILGGDGKPAKELPLKDGYFEVALPRAFFEGNPRSITANWIDFYRN